MVTTQEQLPARVQVASIELHVFGSKADVALQQLRERFQTVQSIRTNADYDLVRSGIAECRGLRVAIEDRRKELKRDIIDAGRIIDSEASRLEQLVRSVEDPLAGLKQAADEEKARIKAEKEAEKRREIEEQMRLKLEQEEKQRREAEALRAAELEKERVALEAQRAEIERARLEAMEVIRKQQDALRLEEEKRQEESRKQREAQQAELRKQQEEIRKREAEVAAEAQRIRVERMVEEERLKRERQAVEEERKRQLEIAQAEQDRLRLAEMEKQRIAMLPHWEQYCEYLGQLLKLKRPSLEGEPAQRLAHFVTSISREVDSVRSTQLEGGEKKS